MTAIEPYWWVMIALVLGGMYIIIRSLRTLRIEDSHYQVRRRLKLD